MFDREHRSRTICPIFLYFFEDDVFIWYSLYQDKFQFYAHLCQLFVHEYFKLKHTSDLGVIVNLEHTNKSFLLRPPVVTNAIIHDNLINSSSDKLILVADHDTSSNSRNNHLSDSILSMTIVKTLVDKFITDLLKFSAGKENVITWIDEIEQQFNMMHLSNPDKLNLIHIYLNGEALEWFKQHKHKFTCWTIFIHEIKESFTSNLQRDLAFENSNNIIKQFIYQ
ncbi:unnamed protein product [Adineta steineri]|uniref:Retrotransposon gag domain-containing protein n=1 Tax=Adineta steineri TaxID=433720 RepID=A0A819U2K5_9BILA|nr:unnamed protein product [Adineta steineri]CAF4090648.1 unnamed protein product [Adineta steineri]